MQNMIRYSTLSLFIALGLGCSAGGGGRSGSVKDASSSGADGAVDQPSDVVTPADNDAADPPGPADDAGGPGPIGVDSMVPEPEDVPAPTPDTPQNEDGGQPVQDTPPPVPDPGPPPTPDAGPSTCVPGSASCIYPPPGDPDAEIVQLPGSPAPLSGGTPPDETYELVLAEIYPDTLGGGVLPIPMEITSNGNTYGSAIFDNGTWGLSANLDLVITVELLGQSLPIAQSLNGGGCYSVSGSTLTGDMIECAQGELPPFDLPDTFGWETDGDVLRMHVVFPKEAILAAIPPEYADLAGAFIQGDLELVLELKETL